MTYVRWVFIVLDGIFIGEISHVEVNYLNFKFLLGGFELKSGLQLLYL